MGRYFGLVNATKDHCVSSYWKGSPPSSDEVKKIGELLQWDLKADKIVSSSYCDYCVWNGEKSEFEEEDFSQPVVFSHPTEEDRIFSEICIEQGALAPDVEEIELDDLSESDMAEIVEELEVSEAIDLKKDETSESVGKKYSWNPETKTLDTNFDSIFFCN